MRTLIAYATKHGGTKQCAERLARLLPGAEPLEITKATRLDLAPYDAVILGTPIYMGRPRKAMRTFCKRHQSALLEKRLGLFLCCIQDQENLVGEQLAVAYPAPLRERAVAKGALGGVVAYDTLGRFEKYIMDQVAGDLYKQTGHGAINTISDLKIERFAAEFITGQSAP